MRRWSRTSSDRLIRRSQSSPPVMEEIQEENLLGQLNLYELRQELTRL